MFFFLLEVCSNGPCQFMHMFVFLYDCCIILAAAVHAKTYIHNLTFCSLSIAIFWGFFRKTSSNSSYLEKITNDSLPGQSGNEPPTWDLSCCPNGSTTPLSTTCEPLPCSFRGVQELTPPSPATCATPCSQRESTQLPQLQRQLASTPTPCSCCSSSNSRPTASLPPPSAHTPR